MKEYSYFIGVFTYIMYHFLLIIYYIYNLMITLKIHLYKSKIINFIMLLFFMYSVINFYLFNKLLGMLNT